jgi:hypothetical protein
LNLRQNYRYRNKKAGFIAAMRPFFNSPPLQIFLRPANNGRAELLLCPNIRAATQRRPTRKTINEINARGISVV